MNIVSELSFRALENKYLYIACPHLLGLLSQHFAGDEATGILAYCYIKHEEGLQFEVLCKSMFDADKKTIRFFDANDEVSFGLPYGLMQSNAVMVLPEAILPLDKHKAKVAKLAVYGASEEQQKARNIAAIDGSRRPEQPDEVLVYLSHEETVETVYVRLEGVGKMDLYGTLLNEPQQDFGIHEGEELHFFIAKNEQGIMCIAPR